MPVRRASARPFHFDEFVDATPAVQERLIRLMTPEHMLKMDADFESWAHRNQLPPPSEGWRTWLMMAGRGFGKTRAGAEWIFRLAEGKPGARIALVGGTIAEARMIMVEGVSGLLAVANRYGRRLNWEPSLGRLTWPNGSQAQLFSGETRTGCAGRSIISPGAMSSRSGRMRKRLGTICSSGFGAGRGRGRW